MARALVRTSVLFASMSVASVGFQQTGLKVHPDAHLVEGVDHFVFLAPCSESLAAAAPQICQDPTGFDRAAFHRAAFHRAFNKAVIDLFTTKLLVR